MNTKKLFATLCASAMVLAACTACGGSSNSESNPDADTTAPAEPATTAATAQKVESEPIVFEKPVVAESGEAYLAVTDAQIWVQYWGKDTDLLTYDATTCKIDGNGSYTVGVTADTNGFRFDATDDANGQVDVSGIAFMAVIIKDGEERCPDAIITIDSIKFDGKEIEMIAKNYTSTEDHHIRTNINNPYISECSGDARSTEGYLFKNNDITQPAIADADAYSPHVIDVSKIGSWKTIEVNFTISGMGESMPEPEETDAPVEQTESPETTTSAAETTTTTAATEE